LRPHAAQRLPVRQLLHASALLTRPCATRLWLT
jgi:hypothetical protein